MACKRIAVNTNKADSILFDTIYNDIVKDEERAVELYSYFQTPEFLNKFGNWIEDYGKSSPEFINRVDDNFEPKLFKEEDTNKYYFKDIEDNIVYFPLEKNGLSSIYSFKYINGITAQLAFSYFDKNFTNDFNNIDFSETKGQSLKDFVTQTIKDKVSELEKGSMLNKINAKALNKSLGFIDEWVENIDRFYKQLGLLRNDNEDDLDDLTPYDQDVRDSNFNTSSFEKSTKESVSSNIKLRLSLIKDFENLDLIWKAPSFIKFDDIYGTLLQKLPNKVAVFKDGVYEDLFDMYLQDIQNLSKSKPYFNQLYQYLKDADERVKSEFTQAFNLHRNKFLNSEFSIEFDKEEDVYKFTYSIKDISNVGSKEKIILSDWGNNFKQEFLDDKNILKEDKVKYIDKVVTDLNQLKDNLQKINNLKDGKLEAIQAITNRFKEQLSKVGVNLTTKGLDYFMSDFDNPNLTLDNKVVMLSNSITEVNEVLNKVGKTYKKKNSNFKNLFEDQKLFTTLGEAEAFYLAQGTDASIRTGGKNKWLYSYPSYLSTRILSWKKDRNLLLEHYMSKAYNQESLLMEYLLAEDFSGINESAKIAESKRRINNFDLGIFDTFQEEDNSSDIDSAKDISINDYYTDYVNKLLSKSYVRTTTAADKTTDYQIKSGFFLDTNLDYNSAAIDEDKIVFKGNELDTFIRYFKSEYNRMIEAKRELDIFANEPSKLRVYYHGSIDNPGNAFKSQLFPDLSYSSKTTNPLAINIKNLLYDNNGFPSVRNGITLDLETPAIRSLLASYIQKELSRGILDTGRTLRQVGIFEIVTNKEGRSSLVNKNIDTNVFKRYSDKSNSLIRIASDVYINGLINNIEYSKLFSGDPAYYKNMVDYKKRIPATYTDGLQLRLDQNSLTFKVAVINSIKIASPFMDKLKNTIGDKLASKYSNNNSADAQAWITPQRWKFLLERLGKFTKSHEGVYDKMISGENVEYTVEELKLAAQPVKGVYFEINEGAPTYLKYSQAVLTPQLVRGTDLEKVYNQMIKQNVDELITLDGIKVGASTPVPIHNADGSLKDVFQFNTQILKNSGWKLQQDLPTKTFKDTEVGSQIQKNIFAGLKFNINKIFNLNGTEVSGQDIISEINETVGALSNRGWSSLEREFNIDKKNKINNIKGFYNAIIDELEKRGGSLNVVEALKKELPLYGIPQAAQKVINVFSSIMTKRLVKIKTNGGSFIQMSNFGLNKTEGDSKGVIWSPNALSTTHEPYKYINENGKIVIRPGGILISGSWIAKYIPDYKKYTPEQLFGRYENGILVQEGLIDSRIYTNLIGYRIPNQGLASNDALEIVGILPEENGDTVVAYTGITTKTGSDFDIDKMYMMFPSFKKNNNGSLSYVEYDYNKSAEEQTKEALQNRLIELYKAVLTQEDVIKDVMNPIDIEFIKDDIIDLFPEQPDSNLVHFDAVKDIRLKYEFSAGKAGVGQEANAVVDINRLGKISLNNVYLGWGHSINDTKGDTEFDREYSVELSKEDLNYYLEHINRNRPQNNLVQASDVNKVKIADSLQAILNAFVDIAKDPYITRGNWVTNTTNTGNMLIRAGMHPLYVTAFIAQPIIRQYIDFTSNNESKTVENTGDMKFKFMKNFVLNVLKDEETIINGKVYKLETLYDALVTNSITPTERLKPEIISRQLGIKGYDKLNNTIRDDIKVLTNRLLKAHEDFFESDRRDITKINLKSLREQINKPDGDIQQAIMFKFFELQDLSKNLRENVDVSKVDTNGSGKNINSMFIIRNLRDSIFNKELEEVNGAINGFDSKIINEDGTFTTLGHYYSNAIDNTIELVQANPKLFPQAHPKVQEIFNEVSIDITGANLMDDNIGSLLEQQYYSYVMSQFEPFNVTRQEYANIISTTPDEFKEFRDKGNNKENYLILQELEYKSEGFLGLNNRKKSSDFEQAFIDSWRDLLKVNPELGNKLIQYSFLTSGFEMSRNQFFTYIPNEWLVENGIDEFMTNYNNNLESTEFKDDFIDKMYLNNTSKYLLVPNVFKNQVDYLDPEVKNYDSGFTMKNPEKSRYFLQMRGKKETLPDGTTTKGATKYYKLVGYTEDYQGIYKRIAKLGFKDSKGNKMVEYLDATVVSSNKVVFDNIDIDKSFDRDYYYMLSLDNQIVDNIYRDITYSIFISELEKLNVPDVMTIEEFESMSQEEIRTALEQAKKC